MCIRECTRQVWRGPATRAGPALDQARWASGGRWGWGCGMQRICTICSVAGAGAELSLQQRKSRQEGGTEGHEMSGAKWVRGAFRTRGLKASRGFRSLAHSQGELTVAGGRRLAGGKVAEGKLAARGRRYITGGGGRAGGRGYGFGATGRLTSLCPCPVYSWVRWRLGQSVERAANSSAPCGTPGSATGRLLSTRLHRARRLAGQPSLAAAGGAGMAPGAAAARPASSGDSRPARRPQAAGFRNSQW